MSNKKEDKTEVPLPQPIMMTDGGITPVYMFVDVDDVEATIYRIINETGEQIFYFFANDEEAGSYKKGTQTISYKDYTPSLFQVVYSIVGLSINKVEKVSEALGLSGISESVRFTLPKIPRDLLNEIDGFLREIYNKMGTEAIIMLTYDKTKEGDSPDEGLGWGYVVPTQRNSAAACSYDPPSVVEEMGDNEILVGSIHSHPGMSAFCSGTDKGDQENFDGLHITFGWAEKKTDDPATTKYHAELQMRGKAWSLSPQDIFQERMPSVDYDFSKQIKEKISKTSVSGKFSGKKGKSNYGWESDDWSMYDYSWNTTGKVDGPEERKIPSADMNLEYAPEIIEDVDFTSPGQILILAPLELHEDIAVCIACDAVVDEVARKRFRCQECLSFFHGIDFEKEDIAKERRKIGETVAGLSFTKYQYQDVWYWEEVMEEKQLMYIVDQVHEGTGKIPAGIQQMHQKALEKSKKKADN